MGGAFIAVADDATAASWNPGGLIQLERPEVSVVGAYFYRIEDNSFTTNPEASGDQSVSKATLNYLSASYPFMLFRRNMIVSLSYQYLFDFTREWNFPLQGDTIDQDIHYKQDGSLSALGVAYCIQVIPQLSIGFTLNFWEDFFYHNGWEQTAVQEGRGISGDREFAFESSLHDRYSFSGFNANVGLLWHITGKLALGAVLKTPFTADLEHESSFSSSVTFPSSPGLDTTDSIRFTESGELDMPMRYGLGLAYHYSDKGTVSIDFTRTEWQNFVLRDEEGNEISPISGKLSRDSDIDATNQFRAGTEYRLIQPRYVLLIHGGFFYDPAPADGSPDDFWGVAAALASLSGRSILTSPTSSGSAGM